MNGNQRVSWHDRLPIVMYVDQSVPAEFHIPIRNAMQTWNSKMNRSMLRWGGIVDSPTARADGYNVIYYKLEWAPQREFEQAQTHVYYSSNQLYEADVLFNAMDNQFTNGSTPGKIDFESVILHEFGHVLGLEHNVTDSNSVMSLSLASNFERRIPSQKDINSLHCEY